MLIQFICPVCKTSKELKISKLIINQAKQLTTVSIPKDKICKHHFQAFVDKNFKVRGYQKVDFVFSTEKIDNQMTNDDELFKNLEFQGNILKYNIKNSQDNNNNKKKGENPPSETTAQYKKKKKPLVKEKKQDPTEEMTLEEIYEQFWEFIEDDNSEFKEFIIKDTRRGSKI